MAKMTGPWAATDAMIAKVNASKTSYAAARVGKHVAATHNNNEIGYANEPERAEYMLRGLLRRINPNESNEGT